MRRLEANEMLLEGGGRCGNAWQSVVVETTFVVAAGAIGFAVTGATPVGALFGARAGAALGMLVCRTS